MDTVQLLIGIIGGLGIFLYGMYIASEGLKKSASYHLKNMLTKATKNQVYGSISGIILAAVLQSSSAATVMTVGFVNAGLITLRQAMGVVLGSAIGTTLTVQLIAFKVTDYALIFVGVGVLLFLLASTPNMRPIGSILLGFGFVFFGMGLLNSSMLPLQELPQFSTWFLSITDNLFITVLFAVAVTAIIQNSAATIGIAMSLAISGSLSLEAAIAIVYGANIGTVVTALISSLSASRDAKRTAVAHAIFKIIGVIVFLPLTGVFIYFLNMMGGSLERQIANAHTIFNIVNLLILLPFCNKFADWMVKIMPDKDHLPKGLKHLDKESIKVPTVALLQTRKELENLAGIIGDKMLKPFPLLLEEKEHALRQNVIREESKIDAVYEHIMVYLKKVTEANLTAKEAEEALKLLYINNDLEGISDSLEKMTAQTIKMFDAGTALCKREKEGVLTLHREVYASFSRAIQAFEHNERDTALEVINRNPMIMRMEKKLRYEHFHDGLKETLQVNSVYVDIMNELLMLNHHVINISHTLIGMIKEETASARALEARQQATQVL